MADQIQDAAQAFVSSLIAQIDQKAQTYHGFGQQFKTHTHDMLREYLLTGPGAPPDSRSKPWACRFRLYGGKEGEPLADSEPDLQPEQFGTWLINGLPRVAQTLQNLASQYHPETHIVGLDREDLERGIRGLRPTISRHGGWAVWRVTYWVDGREFYARVDVRRAS